MFCFVLLFYLHADLDKDTWVDVSCLVFRSVNPYNTPISRDPRRDWVVLVKVFSVVL